ncbi:hypothetical protein A2V71_03510 [Candidatus Berkelbacteria bacterium RBG_13_40_8]|uniref:Glycosyltransferase subfamily 4-like N-terminal domain-containing protein n=1 Tax=Candidatus Berkelbacteria bacterium RBG_13_40_8 TaxID=1797467 RepID=A0A1F5DNC7_9BACT|nr:MAG: hypothetical protein A2V71_03510 [Candidatus Berkelbacteria bacterium RBG_13_40_8]
MKILLITQWYKPIKGAVKRMARIADHLSKPGNEVTVLTGFPSYPTGILPKTYTWKLWASEKDKKVNILRTYEYPTPNKGVIKRLLNYFSFTVSASLAALFLPPQDVVIVSSPSFFAGIAGLIAAKLKKSQFIFDIRDLWPDSAIELGFLKSKWQIKLLETLEKTYYRRANKITTATPGIKRHLLAEKVPPEKLVLLLNSVNTEKFKPQKVSREKYGFKKDDFIVCYVGNHGRLYDLQNIIKTALILKIFPKIKFLFVGEGEEKENLIKLAQKLKTRNVIFLPEKPNDEIIKIVNFSDVGLISLANIKVSQESMPVKASEYLGCGKPVVASISGDMKKYLIDHQAGLIYPTGSAQKAAEAILKLYHNPKLLKKMGLNGRKLALEVFSDKNFYKILDQLKD